MEPTILDIATRLGAAVGLGGLIGLERELHGQPAGLRTHIILSIGAALAAILSIQIAVDYRGVTTNGDPARLAAQVISGIGFLGAGAILRLGVTIKGLTTATSLWTTAIVGLACGTAAYSGAVMAASLVLIALTFFDRVEKVLLRTRRTRVLQLSVHDRPGMIDEIRGLIEDQGVGVKSISVTKSIEAGMMDVEILVKVPSDLSLDPLIGALTNLGGARDFSLK